MNSELLAVISIIKGKIINGGGANPNDINGLVNEVFGLFRTQIK